MLKREIERVGTEKAAKLYSEKQRGGERHRKMSSKITQDLSRRHDNVKQKTGGICGGGGHMYGDMCVCICM